MEEISERVPGVEKSADVSTGEEVERCKDCGRTFAVGRLQSHAKVEGRFLEFFFLEEFLFFYCCSISINCLEAQVVRYIFDLISPQNGQVPKMLLLSFFFTGENASSC